MIIHPIFRVRSFQVDGPYVLRVQFDDDSERVINFEQVLAGELYAPLLDPVLFNQVSIDPEIQTLGWPNGADFDPAMLHDWPLYEKDLIARAKKWERSAA